MKNHKKIITKDLENSISNILEVPMSRTICKGFFKLEFLQFVSSYCVVCQWWSRRYPVGKPLGICCSGVFRDFQCKKDQIIGIFSSKLNLYRAGNTTDLVFLPEPNCRFPHGGSLTATSLTDHRITFPLTFDHSKWLILVHFLSLYLQWKCQLLLTKAIQSCWSDHSVQQDEVE